MILNWLVRVGIGAVWAVSVCGFALAQDSREKAIVDLANQAREDAGLRPLVWDAGLAQAAKAHAELMANEGPISHRYGGEADLPERAAKAGARFSLIEENIAYADTALHVHQGWMRSPMHHDNLLNSEIDRIGVGVVEGRGGLYAVADYAKGVESMTTAQVEAAVGRVLVAKGVTILPDAVAARAYCGQEGNSAKSGGGGIKPRFLMRWSSADITNLPPQLVSAIGTGDYKQATVGSCLGSGQVFSGYKVAVLLY